MVDTASLEPDAPQQVGYLYSSHHITCVVMAASGPLTDCRPRELALVEWQEHKLLMQWPGDVSFALRSYGCQ